MDAQSQVIKDYFTLGGVRGQIDGNRISLEGFILGEFDLDSRGILLHTKSLAQALVVYTFFQLMSIPIYENLRESAKGRLEQALGVSDEGSIRRAFVNAFADYAIYGEEFGLVENEELTSLMQDLFDEKRLNELVE